MDKNLFMFVFSRLTNLFVTGVFSEMDGDKLKESLKKDYFKICDFYKNNLLDWNNLSKEDCKFMGFYEWNKECYEEFVRQRKSILNKYFDKKELDDQIEINKRFIGLFFIPNYMFGMIPDGLELIDRCGKKVKFNRETADRTSSLGILNYGFFPKDAKRYEDYEKEDEGDAVSDAKTTQQ
jgi:hypothetical protein